MDSTHVLSSLHTKKHLSKYDRFPRTFREAARILKTIKTDHQGIKTVLYSSKFKGQCFKKIYGLTYTVMKNLRVIDKVIEEIDLLKKEPYLDLESTEVMISEIVIKKKTLPGNSKPVLALMKHEKNIKNAFLNNLMTKHDELFIPRYVRIHTLITTITTVINWLRANGYKQINLESTASFSDFCKAVKQLNHHEFVEDFHFSDILIFSSCENFSQTTLYLENYIFLQDKASYLPVCALAPPLNSCVLDCCAAPGIKTVHLACVMKNTGNLLALDKDIKRFSVLKNTLRYGNVTNCKAFNIDFTSVNPHQEPFSSVEYILLDPSCSGSGMKGRFDASNDNQFSECPKRLNKLARFQITLLKHALKFPNVKRIVYSTCSINEVENEYVINEALKNHEDHFQVSNILPEWQTRGFQTYHFGKFCVRAFTNTHLTNGFFVATIEKKEFCNKSTISVRNQ